MKSTSKVTLIGGMIACFVAQAVLQGGIGPQPTAKDYEVVTVTEKQGKQEVVRSVKRPKQGAPTPAFQGLTSRWGANYSQGTVAAAGLSPDQLLFALAGFREMIAGILWVRADSFFDSGNYDAILPIIRLVTILDPGQIDVFATGMWHIGYNFTDEEQRSDRRYIPAALALGKEGANKNPTTYELFFETGWMWYHKIDDDYAQAVEWFKQARERPDMIPARRNLLAMAYQRNGQVQEAMQTYADLFKTANDKFYEDPTVFGNRQNRDTLENNLDTTLVRMVQRGWVAGQEGRSLQGYDPYPPFDVGFSVKATVIDARVIRFEGTWRVLPVGTRVRVILRDADFPNAAPGGMKWDQGNTVNLDPPRNTTFMQDQLFVRNRRFNRRVDMSKDPTMYPFVSERYVLEFYYNPRSAPPHMQDKFSWNGEGITDSNFLNTDVREGQRVIFTTLELTKDQILRRGEWQDKVPVVKTANYVETGPVGSAAQDVLVDIPSLRAQ
jgi:tetratricopeptide (TPR) repeat protein